MMVSGYLSPNVYGHTDQHFWWHPIRLFSATNFKNIKANGTKFVSSSSSLALTCVGIAEDVRVGGLADGLNEGPHLDGSEGAIQADAEQKKLIYFC